jgi:hypothetical protein
VPAVPASYAMASELEVDAEMEEAPDRAGKSQEQECGP